MWSTFSVCGAKNVARMFNVYDTLVCVTFCSVELKTPSFLVQYIHWYNRLINDTFVNRESQFVIREGHRVRNCSLINQTTDVRLETLICQSGKITVVISQHI